MSTPYLRTDLVDCGVCHRSFDPFNSPSEIIAGEWVCCAANNTPEELAEALDISVSESYEAQGLEQPEIENDG